MLEMKNLGFEYGENKAKYRVFQDINIKIRSNELFCIIGRSGCRKSTLLKILAGFENPSEGTVYNDETKIENILVI